VANAILDGTDAIMLSEETAQGAFPVQAVKVMARVAADIEPLFDHDGWTARLKASTKLSFEAAVAHTAVEMATDIGAAAILTCTTSGSTSRLVARYRPRQPLLAMTPHLRTAVRLALTFGAVPVVMGETDSAEELERGAIAAALQNGHVKPGQPVVITAGLPFNRAGTTNLIKVATAEWD
jgi:pyruvate kinase